MPFIGKQREMMEFVRMDRIQQAQKIRKVKDYSPGDRVIIQETDKAGHWIKTGEIIYQTKGINSCHKTVRWFNNDLS